ncbi:glycosyltransferase family 2 protein [Oricola sp.]|uniref:glycosyltransferase family 2 protein n=1 Tax=Oricola sp. TaxID=1979950 RepID=UPI0025E2BE26|nr:glycosyltransferase family 2 protein [Oricola sp.]MCI5077675.1 glycosyltransferase family 2 protein [Oricola sp.]
MFSVVIVTYESAAVLPQALASIPAGHEVIVVDNASADGSADVASDFGARVMALSANAGFGTACNRGAEIATGDILFFLNPDARLEPSTLDRLAAAFDRHPRAGAANPRMLDGDGRQSLQRRNKVLPRRRLFQAGLPQADEEMAFLCGGALAIRRNIFGELGGFDENIFLYYEDDDISARILRAGHKLYYVHDAVVHHLEGQSSPPSDALTDLKEYSAMKSKLYLWEKYGLRRSRTMRTVGEYLRAHVLPGPRERKVGAKARLRALLEAG